MQTSHHPGLAARRPERTAGAEPRDLEPVPRDAAGSPMQPRWKHSAARTAHGLREGPWPVHPETLRVTHQGRRAGSALASRALHSVPAASLGQRAVPPAAGLIGRRGGLPLDMVLVSACDCATPKLLLQTARALGCSL